MPGLKFYITRNGRGRPLDDPKEILVLGSADALNIVLDNSRYVAISYDSEQRQWNIHAWADEWVHSQDPKKITNPKKIAIKDREVEP